MGKHALESFVSASYQPLDGDLTSIAGLSGSAGLLRKTNIDTFTLDTNTYLTGNQTITLSGDVSGSGTTSVSVTLANSGVSASTYGSATQIPSITVDAKGRITSASAITFESLPSQTGQSGKYLTTNGTVASWGVVDLSTKANINSPTFTGVPAAPTAAADTNTTQLATTAYVVNQAGTANPVMNGTVAVGTSLRYARQDHVHASDTSRAALTGATFTGVVTGVSPTAAGSIGFRRQTMSTAAPSGGLDGDVWLRY
jgi:hypothetical protein